MLTMWINIVAYLYHTLVGIRTGPFTFSCFSLAPLIRSAQTAIQAKIHFIHLDHYWCNQGKHEIIFAEL